MHYFLTVSESVAPVFIDFVDLLHNFGMFGILGFLEGGEGRFSFWGGGGLERIEGSLWGGVNCADCEGTGEADNLRGVKSVENNY